MGNPGPRLLLRRAVAALSREQLGLISRTQAEGLGLTAAAIGRRLSSGEWLRLLPSVYAVAAVPVSDAQSRKAAELWAGEGAALSHRSALSLWGGPACDFLELSSPHRRMPRPGIRLHHVCTLPSEHVTVRDGVRLTTPERTLMDLAPLLDFDELSRVVDDFFSRHLCSPASLQEFLSHERLIHVPGRHLLHVLLRKRRRQLPRTALEANAVVTGIIQRNHGIVPQAIEHPGLSRPLIGYPDQRVILEVDKPEDPSQATARQVLRGEGWHVHALPLVALKRKPRHFIHKLRELLVDRSDLPPVTPKPPGLPQYNPASLSYRLRQLFNCSQLPPALQAMGFYAALAAADMELYGEFSPECLEELRQIILDLNASSPQPAAA